MNKSISQDQFYNDLWLNQWADMEKYNPTARHLKRFIAQLIYPLSDVNSLLDVGCGMGFNIEDLRKNFPQLKLTGADITEPIIELAKQYTGVDSHTTYKTIDLGLENLDASEQYDLVLCNQVLEHIENDFLAIQNLTKLTNKYILITVPSGRYNSTSKLVGHHRHYSKADLVNKLNSAHLSIIYIREWGFPFHSLYKTALGSLSPESQTAAGMGKYGMIKKGISNILYTLFSFNIFNRGENIIVLAAKR